MRKLCIKNIILTIITLATTFLALNSQAITLKNINKNSAILLYSFKIHGDEPPITQGIIYAGQSIVWVGPNPGEIYQLAVWGAEPSSPGRSWPHNNENCEITLDMNGNHVINLKAGSAC